jgi:DNA repair photolyase
MNRRRCCRAAHEQLGRRDWEGKRMRIHEVPLSAGITRTREFERKKLASFAVNAGTKCGHGCLYCSTGSMLRMHRSFAQAGEDPFGAGYAIVDPSTPGRVAADARRTRERGLVQLCTTVDAWAPEAQEHNLGRRCLEAILCEPGWTVRILTKNAAVRKDFDFIERHRDRVLVGLSITATPDKEAIVNVIEPNASSISDRMATLREATERGVRTYGMFCPLLPGIADSPEQIDELIQFAVSCRAEEVFVEAVNPRGPGLRRCQEALELWGYPHEAQAVGRVRHKVHWSRYVAGLVRNVQQSMRRFSDIGKLRFLLYPSRLTDEDRARIASDDVGVIWLGRG